MALLSNFKASFKVRLRFILFSIILLTTGSSAAIAAPNSRIRCSTERLHQVPSPHQIKLAELLRHITGFTQLTFTPEGFLNLDTEQYQEGSATAREAIREAIAANAMMEIQDHSRSESINFGQFEAIDITVMNQPGLAHTRWEVRLDFEDFVQMNAPPEVRESFNEGFVFLHEVLHGLGKADTKEVGQIGECEAIVNQMRDELGLALRTQYHGEWLRITSPSHWQRLQFKRLVSTRGKLIWKKLSLEFLPGAKTIPKTIG